MVVILGKKSVSMDAVVADFKRAAQCTTTLAWLIGGYLVLQKVKMAHISGDNDDEPDHHTINFLTKHGVLLNTIHGRTVAYMNRAFVEIQTIANDEELSLEQIIEELDPFSTTYPLSEVIDEDGSEGGYLISLSHGIGWNVASKFVSIGDYTFEEQNYFLQCFGAFSRCLQEVGIETTIRYKRVGVDDESGRIPGLPRLEIIQKQQHHQQHDTNRIAVDLANKVLNSSTSS